MIVNRNDNEIGKKIEIFSKLGWDLSCRKLIGRKFIPRNKFKNKK